MNNDPLPNVHTNARYKSHRTKKTLNEILGKTQVYTNEHVEQCQHVKQVAKSSKVNFAYLKKQVQRDEQIQHEKRIRYTKLGADIKRQQHARDQPYIYSVSKVISGAR